MSSIYHIVEAKKHSVATGSGLDTGVAVAPGQLLVITANRRDLWSAGGGPRQSNADGLGNPYGHQFGEYERGGYSFLYGSLVGSIDGGKTYFPIGTQCQLTMLSKGKLSLYYWDSNDQDNSGEIRVDVKLYRGPEQL